MTNDILKTKKMQGLSWNQLAEGLPISGNGLRVAFSRGTVNTIYIDFIVKKLNLKSVQNKQNKTNISFRKKRRQDYLRGSLPLYDKKLLTHTKFSLKDKKDASVISIPNIPKCDGSLVVYDDGMHPLIKKEDIVFFKNIEKIPESIFFGKIYLIFIEVEGEILSVLRYLRKGRDKNHFLLISENEKYESKEIHINQIKQVALIKGGINFY